MKAKRNCPHVFLVSFVEPPLGSSLEGLWNAAFLLIDLHSLPSAPTLPVAIASQPSISGLKALTFCARDGCALAARRHVSHDLPQQLVSSHVFRWPGHAGACGAQ
jgi:hypothetical protein